MVWVDPWVDSERVLLLNELSELAELLLARTAQTLDEMSIATHAFFGLVIREEELRKGALRSEGDVLWVF